MTDNLATIHPQYAALAILPNGETITKVAALEQGYRFDDGIKQAPAIPVKINAVALTYLTTVIALPEAKDRPIAAAALGAAYNHQTLSLTNAASLLRGLPTETAKGADAMTIELSNNDRAVFRRKAELRAAALSQSSNNGNERAGVEARKIRYGLSIADTTGASFGDAFAAAGLDARATITAILA